MKSAAAAALIAVLATYEFLGVQEESERGVEHALLSVCWNADGPRWAKAVEFVWRSHEHGLMTNAGLGGRTWQQDLSKSPATSVSGEAWLRLLEELGYGSVYIADNPDGSTTAYGPRFPDGPWDLYPILFELERQGWSLVTSQSVPISRTMDHQVDYVFSRPAE